MPTHAVAEISVIQGPSTQAGERPSQLPAVPVPGPPSAMPPTFDATTVKSCTDAVDGFRTGTLSRVEASYEILDALRGVGGMPKETVLQASRAYFGMLESWERSQRSAHERGVASPGVSVGGTGTRGTGAETTPTQPTQAESPTPERDNHSLVGTKRRRAASLDDSDDDERTSRKRPLDFSELPWFDEGEDSASLLPETLERTRRLILSLADEPRRWKTYFTNRRDCPQFPDAEWTNIIAGKAVNLDAVHSSMFSVALESKHKEKFGRISIAFNDVVPSKTVKTHGDWLAAWERTSAAITFIFRHRSSELDGYRSHISQLFTVLGPSMPDPVLNYDKGVRIRASSRRDLLLTDVIAFLDLQTHYITIGSRSGNGAPQSSGTRSSGKPRKRDACHRWNDGKCPNSSKDCNYLHCCAKCMATGHTAGACSGRA